jgi:hypothetical protein
MGNKRDPFVARLRAVDGRRTQRFFTAQFTGGLAGAVLALGKGRTRRGKKEKAGPSGEEGTGLRTTGGKEWYEKELLGDGVKMQWLCQFQ